MIKKTYSLKTILCAISLCITLFAGQVFAAPLLMDAKKPIEKEPPAPQVEETVQTESAEQIDDFIVGTRIPVSINKGPLLPVPEIFGTRDDEEATTPNFNDIVNGAIPQTPLNPELPTTPVEEELPAPIKDIYTIASLGTSNSKINVQIIGGVPTMVLPSLVKPEAITLYMGEFSDVVIEEPTEETAEAITEEVTEVIADETAEEITEEVTEVIADETTEEITEEATEVTADETAEEITEETTEVITDETAEEITEEVTEVIAEETAEVIAEEVTEVIADETTEVITEETAEEITEEVTEVITDETAEEITEEVTEVITDETATYLISGTLKTEPFKSGKTINLNEFCENGEYNLTFTAEDSSFQIRFLFSGNIPAMFLVSENPEEKGRAWVESSPDKSNKAKGNMLLIKENGEVVHEGELTQIKGRGNSTWGREKKPYQIKTSDKVDLLETGIKDNKTKTWVLLANALDPSLVNNHLMLNMGKLAGMESYIENRHVDLYYDGEYRGNYLISEKVEVGDDRVNIADMDDKNKEANEGTDIESLPTATGKTANGATFKYCVGMKSPEDITGGYLLEMDFEDRALAEVCYMRTTRGQYVVVKSPEFASFEEMDYIATLYQEYEDAVYNDGVNPDTQKKYSEYVDINSIAAYFAVNELAYASDFLKSSAYLYKNEGEDKMYMGPLWDYDLCLGRSGVLEGITPTPYGVYTYKEDFAVQLLKNTDLATTLYNLYTNTMKPYIKDVLLNAEAEGSLAQIREYLRPSAEINSLMWHPESPWATYYRSMEKFLIIRADTTENYLLAYKKIADGEERKFIDVNESDWFYDTVLGAAQLGIMNGTAPHLFDPYMGARRAEVAQAIYNMEDGATEEKEAEKNAINEVYEKTPTSNNVFENPRVPQNFKDVSQTDWFVTAVDWASKKGIITGTPDGSFLPYQDIKREELVTILHRLAGSPELVADLSIFPDGASVSEYANGAMQWAIASGVIGGDSYGKLSPQAKLTRAELATILYRYNSIKNTQAEME